VALEGDLGPDASCLDAINGFNEMERDAMRASIVAHLCIHCLFPLFDMLYMDRVGELWFCNENGAVFRTYHSCKGVLHGCVMRTFLFCLAIAFYLRPLRSELGQDGSLFGIPGEIHFMGQLKSWTWPS
jgi:hypothetical protein